LLKGIDFEEIFMFFYNYSLCIVDAYFFLFLLRKKKKEIGERKQKKNRGRFWAASLKTARKSPLAVLRNKWMLLRSFLQKCSPTLRIFGMFCVAKICAIG